MQHGDETIMQTLSRSLSLGRLHDAEPAPAAPALTRGRYSAPAVLQDLAAQADVSFDGERPWDIQVHDPAFYHRVLVQRHRSELLEAGYDERFLRMWRSCSAPDAASSGSWS